MASKTDQIDAFAGHSFSSALIDIDIRTLEGLNQEADYLKEWEETRRLLAEVRSYTPHTKVRVALSKRVLPSSALLLGNVVPGELTQYPLVPDKYWWIWEYTFKGIWDPHTPTLYKLENQFPGWAVKVHRKHLDSLATD